MKLLVSLCLITVSYSLPAPNEKPEPTKYVCLKSAGPIPATLSRARIDRDIPGFHYLFVTANGDIQNKRGPSGTQVEIAGSPKSSALGLRAAASIVVKMTKYMPPSIFTKLAQNSGVGIFTAAEKLIVFPEYADLANGNCGSSCNGSCAHTCTFDGRKYQDIGGVTSVRSVVLEDNVLCTPRDPRHHTQNILSHEFTHAIHNNAVPDSVKQQIVQAYQTAKSRATWVLSSYAMANEKEYLAEGGSVYFFVNRDTWGSGKMDLCGSTLCTREEASREHLRTADPGLYNVLTYIFTNNRPHLLSGLTVCPPQSVVGKHQHKFQARTMQLVKYMTVMD